jgi:hypothetical protein
MIFQAIGLGGNMVGLMMLLAAAIAVTYQISRKQAIEGQPVRIPIKLSDQDRSPIRIKVETH